MRQDLAEAFATFRTESVEDLRQQYGEAGAEVLAKESEYTERHFLRAALSVLGEQGTAEDAGLVRSYLSHEQPDVRAAALNALRLLDPAEAAVEALRIATADETSEPRFSAARMAIELSDAAALPLTESDDAAIVSLAAAVGVDIVGPPS